MSDANLDLPAEFVLPDYESGTIANIPATIAALLEVPFDGLPPLRPELWQPFQGRTRRVVILLIDSFGWPLFQRQRPQLRWLIDRAPVQEQITSVFPSTTVAALTSLWTGVAPAQHGLLGLRLLFPDQAVLGQMLRFSPNFAAFPDSLVGAGVEPEHYLPVPSVGQQFAGNDVPVYALKGYDIIDSALSRMHDRGLAGERGIASSSDLFIRLTDLLEETAGQPLYVNAYWPKVDALMHLYGPDHPVVAAELDTVIYQLRTLLWERLSPAARADTVLFITGDHGQVLTDAAHTLHVDDHPLLRELLLMRAAGEPRAPYLYARQSRLQELLDYLGNQFSHALVPLHSRVALASGLLGPPPHAPASARRIADALVLMRQNYLWLHQNEAAKVGRMVGRHGGLTAPEMHVPWLGIPLD